MPTLLGLTATEVDDKPLATTADSLDSPRGMFVVFHEVGIRRGGARWSNGENGGYVSDAWS